MKHALMILAMLILGAAPARCDDKDKAEFQKMLSLFEQAVNENRFDLIRPYIDPSFKGSSVAGTDMLGPDQIQAFMNVARFIMGPNAKYHLKIHPNQIDAAGGRARASGTTQEDVILADGQKISYKSNWAVDFVQRDGKWFATRADTKADLRDKLTVAAKVVASRIWSGGLHFGRVPLGRPDFDQDGGSHTSDGNEQIPQKSAQNGAKPPAQNGLTLRPAGAQVRK